MSWFLFAFLAAVFLSASSLMEKRVLQKVHSGDFSVSLAIFNFILSIPFVFFIDFSAIKGFELLLIFVAALLGAIAFFLVAKGIRHLEISTVAPLLSLSPGTTSLLAFFILGEALNIQQISGILLMMVGSYILTTREHKSLLEPFKIFSQSRYVHLVLLSLLFYSVAAIFDRAILSDFKVSISIYIFFSHIFIAILFILTGGVFGGGLKGIKEGFRVGGVNLFLVSLFTVTYRFFQMEALQIASVGLVSAVKRSSSFFTTLIGGELFHEHNLGRKITAAFVIVAGSLLIAL